MIDGSPIIGIYLAAGKSSRMGKNKLNLPFKEACLGSAAFQAALESKLGWVLAVTREQGVPDWLAPFAKSEGWSKQQVDGTGKGQSASLKEGVKAALALGAEAVMVLLADQPLVSGSIINRLLDEYREPITAAAKKGIAMPPIIISHKLFPLLMELDGDKGARELIRGVQQHIVTVELEEEVFADIDTVEDYDNFCK